MGMGDRAREKLSDNVMSTIVDALSDQPAARQEFLDGLGKKLHFLSLDPGPKARQDLISFVRDWAVDIFLSADDAWNRQIDESEIRIETGDLGEAIDGSEMSRKLLAG